MITTTIVWNTDGALIPPRDFTDISFMPSTALHCDCYDPSLQMEKLRLREWKGFAQGLTAARGKASLKPGFSDHKPTLFNRHLHLRLNKHNISRGSRAPTLGFILVRF